MKQIRFTKTGYKVLKNKYEELLKQRPLAVQDLKKARDMGDLSENGYYKAARSKLSEIDRHLRTFLSDLKNASVISSSRKSSVGIGSVVKISDGKKEFRYEIVGDKETNPGYRKISLLSPIGQAIENKKVGDKIAIQTPVGKLRYKILDIS